MKTLLYLCVLILVGCDRSSGIDGTSSWGPQTNGLQLSILVKGGTNEVVLNQPFTITFRVRNLLTNNVWFLDCQPLSTDPDVGIRWVIISPSGRDISPKKELIGSGIFARKEVRRGETIEAEFDLSQLCKFSEPGVYQVTGRKDVVVTLPNASETAVSLFSNPLKIIATTGEKKVEGNHSNTPAKPR